MIIEENQLYKEDIYAMWQRNFHDPVPYADFYFDEVYGKNEILLNVEGDEKKGMLHLNPYRLRIDGQETDAHYIVGVATDEEYRRQGVMAELLENSFLRLRKRGEFLTYLMPADKAYYLPFDFRFGMTQLEQEMEELGKVTLVPEGEAFTFLGALPQNLETICHREREVGDSRYAVHTAITPDYLARMEKETKSDFARLLFVYDGENYVGRFVMGAENDYMVISQVVCLTEDREAFLKQVIHFCETSYHYGKYQLVLDGSWKPVLQKPGNYSGVRILPVKEKGIIMFRILKLEDMAPYIRGEITGACRIHVEDACLKEQEGDYLWEMDETGCRITRCRKDDGDETDGGTIGIGALTALLFGLDKNEEAESFDGLTEEGKRLLFALRPVGDCCIQEIV